MLTPPVRTSAWFGEALEANWCGSEYNATQKMIELVGVFVVIRSAAKSQYQPMLTEGPLLMSRHRYLAGERAGQELKYQRTARQPVV